MRPPPSAGLHPSLVSNWRPVVTAPHRLNHKLCIFAKIRCPKWKEGTWEETSASATRSVSEPDVLHTRHMETFKRTWCVRGTLLDMADVKRARASLKDSHRVFVPFLLRIVRLPATSGEDVLVLLIPAPQHNFTCVRLWGKEHTWVYFIVPFQCWHIWTISPNC